MNRIPLEDIDWDAITDFIKEEKCVLCIGTEAYRGNQKSVYAEVLEKAVQRFEKEIEVYPQEDLLYFAHEDDKTTAYNYLSKMYQEAQYTSQPLLEKLAEIDFHLVINLSPDVAVKKIFDAYNEQGLETRFGFYQTKKGTIGNIEAPPTRQQPTLYNLFGSVGKSESLVFTHEEVFEYIFSLQEKPLPEDIQMAIKEAKCFLFVGVQLDHWYIKILARLTNFLNKSAVKYASALKEPTNEKFYKQFARFKFVEDQDAWTDKLYAVCKKAGLLRKLGNEAKISHKKVLLEMLDNNYYAEFFAKLDELGVEDMNLGAFKMAFMKGRIDVNFEERLQVFVQNLNI